MARRPQGPPAFATAPGSNARWLIAALALALIAATATAVWALTRPADNGGGDPQTADPTTPSAVPVDNGPADGCLGGADPTTAVTAAQESAPLTPGGAAAFSATFLRWLMQYPRPTADLESTGAGVATSSALESVLASELATSEGGLVAEGAQARATTLGQRYEVVSFSQDEAVVATTIGLVDARGGEEPAETVAFIKLVSEDGRWLFDYWLDESELSAAGLPVGDEELQEYREYIFEEGTPYEGVC